MILFHVGDEPEIEGEFRDAESSELADPDEARLTVRQPDATELVFVWPEPGEDELALERVAAGKFTASFELEQEGAHSYNWRATGDVKGSEPGQLVADPEFYRHIRPTHAHVAAVRRSRTYVDAGDSDDITFGSRAGEFNENTNPTADEVDHLINESLKHVRSRFASGEIPQSLWESAAVAVVCKTALAIELGDFPESAESSPYIQLRRDYDEAMKLLVEAAHLRDLFAE